jgi:hypothetical protein
MQTNPNIILSGNQMAQPRLPDVNAMMQTRTAGMENIYNIEQQRAAQAQAAQKEQEAAALKALSPAIAAAFSDPSDAGLDAALGLVPAQFRDAAEAQLNQIRALPDVGRRKDLIRAGLVQDEAGRTLLAQLEPTAAQRMTADIQRGQLELSKAELAQRRAEANQPAAGDFATIETADGIFMYNKKTGEGRLLTDGGAPAVAGTLAADEGPINVGQPPRVLQPKPTAETAEVVRKRLADEKRAKDLDLAITEVERAMTPGGLIDSATGGLISSLFSDAAAMFSYGTERSAALARLGPIADLALKMVPRFEGPQSNFDVQSYKDAAGNLANPNVPASVKRAAADEIVRLFRKYKDQFEYAPGEVGPEGGGNVIDFNDLGD